MRVKSLSPLSAWLKICFIIIKSFKHGAKIKRQTARFAFSTSRKHKQAHGFNILHVNVLYQASTKTRKGKKQAEYTRCFHQKEDSTITIPIPDLCGCLQRLLILLQPNDWQVLGQTWLIPDYSNFIQISLHMWEKVCTLKTVKQIVVHMLAALENTAHCVVSLQQLKIRI